MKRKLKMLAVFSFVLIVIWDATEPDKPREEAPPKITRRKFPEKAPFEVPEGYAQTHESFAGLFDKVAAVFSSDAVPVLILPPFTDRAGSGGSSALPSYITESAYAYLSASRNLRVVRRDYNSQKRSRIKSRYILIGKINPVADKIHISLRIEHIGTGEILDYFDMYINNDMATFL